MYEVWKGITYNVSSYNYENVIEITIRSYL